MTKVQVYNQAGDKLSELDLNPKIFGLEKIDQSLVHAAVRTQRNNLRGPWAHTKMMGEVAGSGKKPWKQKGTGRARAGSVRSPLWRSGGITFGPRNDRDWSIKMNNSASKKAVFTVLSSKLSEGKLVIADKFESTGKTKEIALNLKQFAAKVGLGKKYCLIVGNTEKTIFQAAGNLPYVEILPADQLNIIDLIKYDLIITQDALNIIEKTYLK